MWWWFGVVVVWQGVVVVLSGVVGDGIVAIICCCWRRRVKRVRLTLRSRAMRLVRAVCVGGRDSFFMVVLVVDLVGLEVELVVVGGCRWRRLLVKRPCWNMPGLSLCCSRLRRGAVVVGVMSGSRGGSFCGCGSRGGICGISGGSSDLVRFTGVVVVVVVVRCTVVSGGAVVLGVGVVMVMVGEVKYFAVLQVALACAV